MDRRGPGRGLGVPRRFPEVCLVTSEPCRLGQLYDRVPLVLKDRYSTGVKLTEQQSPTVLPDR